MKPLSPFFELEKYQITPGDVVRSAFQCEPEAIQPDVILLPWWQPEVFDLWAETIRVITPNVLFEVVYQGKPISVARSGIGAPVAGDMVLSLGCTGCRRILFAGSIGGLHPALEVGDLLLPEFTVAGDGFSRYLEPGWPPSDCFLEHAEPDGTLQAALAHTVLPLAQAAGVAVHHGPVYATDSILAQFGKLEYIAQELGCIGIEMETGAVFKAARCVGIAAAALFSVSDVPVRSKSLYAGRSAAEKERRLATRAQVLARALLECLAE